MTLDKVLNYLKLHTPSLVEDFKKSHYKEKSQIIYKGTTYKVITITQYVAECVLMRHWIWVSHTDTLLVNSEIKFKASFKKRRQLSLSIDKKSKLNTSSQYVSIGMGTQLTKNDCTTVNHLSKAS